MPAMSDDPDEFSNDNQSAVEDALLELLRGNDAKNFTLALTCRDGHCAIYFADLDVPTIRVLGTGQSFAEAWNKRTALWQ
jgi:hypothetical protein